MPEFSPSRRAVVRSTVWAVPVVATAVAAPAFAVSPQCTRQSVAWSAYDGQNLRNQTITATGALAAPITVRITATGNTGTGNNLEGSTTQLGGQNSNLILRLPNNTDSAAESVTLTFSDAVSDLRFSLLDIDSSNNYSPIFGGSNFYDSVTLTSGFTFTRATPLIGNGDNNPFRQSDNDSPVGGGSTNGNVSIVYAGSITVVTINYIQRVPTRGTTPAIGIGNLSFTRAGC